MNFIKCVIFYMLLSIGTHFLGEALPRERFDPTAFPYSQFFWEKSGKLYKLLKVKRWKNRLPDAGDFWPDMQPKRVNGDVTAASLEALVVETCVSEFIHWLLCVAGLGGYIIWPGSGGVTVCILSVFINLQFIIIQRYNRPHLMKLSRWLREREKRRLHTM